MVSVIIQWGKYTEPSNNTTVSFPISFPNAVYAIAVTPADKSPGDGYGWVTNIIDGTAHLDKFTFGIGQDLGSNGSKAYIIAIGK